MKSILINKKRIILSFFIVFTTFLFSFSHASNNLPHQKKDVEIVKYDAPIEISNIILAKSGIEIFILAGLGHFAPFLSFYEIPTFLKPKRIEASLIDSSYNYHFRSILSSRAHPPTV